MGAEGKSSTALHRWIDDWRMERLIRRTLHGLAKQRVALILQPGNVLVIEKAVGGDDETEAALRTCHLRGWADLVSNALPQGDLAPGGELPERPFTRRGPVCRLTEAGWAAVNRSHRWVVATWLVGLASLVASFVALLASEFFKTWLESLV